MTLFLSFENISINSEIPSSSLILAVKPFFSIFLLLTK